MHRHRKANLVKRTAVLRGEELWRALGFGSLRAFQRARADGEITIPLYPIPGQSKGVFALRIDVEDFLKKTARHKSSQPTEEGTDMS